MQEFPELLNSKSHDITFLDFDENRKFRKNKEMKLDQMVFGRVYPQAKLRLVRPFQLGIPGIDRIWVMLTLIPLLVKLLKSNKYDAIILYAVPTYGLQTILLARLFKVPVIFRALDVSHELRKTLFRPLIKVFEKYVYKNVNLISANNQAMAQYCKNLGHRASGVEVHYPPLDFEHFQLKQDSDPIRTNLTLLQSDKIIVYMGSFFYFSGLINVIKIFSTLTKSNDGIKLLLIGGGEQDQTLRKLVLDLNLQEKIIFTGYVNYDQLPKYLRLADIAINTLEPNLVTNTALPNKVLQYLASDLPVISTRLDGLYSVFNNHEAIHWCQSPDEVIQRAYNLLADPNESESLQISDQAHMQLQEILAKFDPSFAVSQFEQSINRVIKEYWLEN